MLVKKMLQFFGLVLVALGLCANAAAAQYGTPDEAVAMVKKAVAFAKAKGKDQLLSEVSLSLIHI